MRGSIPKPIVTEACPPDRCYLIQPPTEPPILANGMTLEQFNEKIIERFRKMIAAEWVVNRMEGE